MTDVAASPLRQKVESSRFGSAVSESLIQGIQAPVNYLLTTALPVGSIVDSMLTEAQFQSLVGSGWILADGRNVASSAYALLTGNTIVPNLAGVYRRGKNNGRASTSGNSAGEIGLGVYEADKLVKHEHYTAPAYDNTDFGSLASGRAPGAEIGLRTVQTLIPGGAEGVGISTTIETEVAPRSVTVNVFIRID